MALLGLVASGAAQSQAGSVINTLGGVNFHAIRTSSDSRITRAEIDVIERQSDFETYWVRATGERAKDAPRNIDWITHEVVAIHLGRRPTGGFSVKVLKINREVNTNFVDVEEDTPSEMLHVSPGPTSPYVVVVVERNSARFVTHMSSRVDQPGILIAPESNYTDNTNSCDWSTYDQGVHCNLLKQQVFVICDPSQFSTYGWVAFGMMPADLPDNVDWANEKLVAIHLGARIDGESMTVRSVEKLGPTATVRLTLQRPGFGRTGLSNTSPFVILRVPRDVQSVTLDYGTGTKPAGKTGTGTKSKSGRG